MELKFEILQKLNQAQGSVSGEEMAKEFGVSRSAIWKAVRTLKREGVAITAVQNCGYCLDGEEDLLDAKTIESMVQFPCRVKVLSKTASTNDEIKRLADAGGEEWDVVLAEEQSEGRGRYNRKFYSQRSKGVYLSILLRPRFTAKETLFITTCAAVAVCEAIEKISGKNVTIKWVNDVLLGGKKVCGILTESSYNVESGQVSYAVVGIGINVIQQEFSKELNEVATSIFTKGEYPQNGRSNIAAEVINRFRRYYEDIPSRSFYEEYKRRSFVLGREVSVVSGNLSGKAKVLDIDNDCCLRVKFENGDLKTISSGEVSIKL